MRVQIPAGCVVAALALVLVGGCGKTALDSPEAVGAALFEALKDKNSGVAKKLFPSGDEINQLFGDDVVLAFGSSLVEKNSVGFGSKKFEHRARSVADRGVTEHETIVKERSERFAEIMISCTGGSQFLLIMALMYKTERGWVLLAYS